MNEPVTAVFERLSVADILIAAHSTFSYAAASMSSVSITLLPRDFDRGAFVRNQVETTWKFDQTLPAGKNFVQLRKMNDEWTLRRPEDWRLRVDEMIAEHDEFNQWTLTDDRGRRRQLSERLRPHYNDSVYPHHRVHWYEHIWKNQTK